MNDRQTDLHITVASGWVEGRTNLSIEHETSLVKAALLYADKVTLASPRVAFLSAVASVLNLDASGRHAEAARVFARTDTGQRIAERIASIRHKRRKSVDDLYLLRDYEREMEKLGESFSQRVENIVHEAGVDEIALAIADGVVTLDGLGIYEQGGTDHLGEGVMDLIARVVAPESTTFPLFDDSTHAWLGAMVREGKIQKPGSLRLTEPAVGAGWISQVAAFPDASMATVLEARESLREPLIRYRGAVIDASRRLTTTPFEKGFAEEAATVHREIVEPALLELRELSAQKRLKGLLLHEIGRGVTGRVGAASIGFLGASLAQLPALVGGAFGVTADTVGSVATRRSEVSDRQRANGFYFLFEANRRLSS